MTGYTAYEGSTLVGNSLDNTLNGRKNADILYGGEGNDTLNGNDGNDILHGGAGNYMLNGGSGSDVYLFGRGDGHDVITESNSVAGRRNVVKLGEGIGIGDIELLNNNTPGSHQGNLILANSCLIAAWRCSAKNSMAAAKGFLPVERRRRTTVLRRHASTCAIP